VNRCHRVQVRRFDEHILIHVTDLYRAARRLTHQDSDAEDLVQETCLRAFKALINYGTSGAKVWVFSILRSVYLRETDRQPAKSAQVSLDDIDASLLGSVEVLRDAYESLPPTVHVLREEVRSAVLKLPLRYREAVVLAHIGGFSYREIAQILHLPWARSCHDCFGAADCSEPASEMSETPRGLPDDLRRVPERHRSLSG